MSSAPEDKKLYKIGEVCRMADVQPYVLRYWETEFPALAPNKSGGGQRLYTKPEIDIILRIKQLLYSEGFTIAGAKKKLEVDLARGLEPAPAEASTAAATRSAPTSKTLSVVDAGAVSRIRDELTAILGILDK